jgi:nucleotide-binding universal stress UspA family protein
MAPQIVIGVDGSETSLHALAAGPDLAEQTGSQPSVVFVRDPSLAGDAGDAGQPARRHAPLIIVGGHPHGARDGVRSVTEHLVRDPSVSVLVVGEPVPEPPAASRPRQTQPKRTEADR